MADPVFGSSTAFLLEYLQSVFPGAKFTDDEFRLPEGLSAQPDRPFVFVQEQGGNTPSHLLLDRPRVEVLCYVYGTKSAGLTFSRAVQRALFMAHFDQVANQHGWIRRLVTEIRPYRQNLSGIPAQIVRTSATYSFGFRSRVPQ